MKNLGFLPSHKILLALQFKIGLKIQLHLIFMWIKKNGQATKNVLELINSFDIKVNNLQFFYSLNHHK